MPDFTEQPARSISGERLEPFPISAIRNLLSDAEALLHTDQTTAKQLLLQALQILQQQNKPSLQARGSGLTTWQARRIDRYVERHLDSRIQSRDLAAVTGLSVSHFCHAFRQTFAETPRNFVAKRRIALAQRLLRAQQESLAQIALKCGFCDQSHFSRVFLKFNGMGPKAWQSAYATEPGCLESLAFGSSHSANEDRFRVVYRP